MQIEAERTRRSLKRFIEAAWPVLEPTTAYSANWHIDAICEHLEAVSRGEIRNLVINIPPRCMKSLIVAVFWPVWSWISQPGMRWLFSSYNSKLSIGDSLKCRRLIESQWFQSRYGGAFRLEGDQNRQDRFENDHAGYRIATSVGGTGLGIGGDVLVADDPHNAREPESPTRRAAALTWWDELMSSRLNDPKTGRKVIVMQRLHEADLSGHVLERGGYVHLRIPMEFEAGARCETPIGWRDPRETDGDLMWPARFGPPEIEALKTATGSYGYAGQYQQRPAPRAGGMIELAWFKRFDAPPETPVRTVQSWDTASKPGERNDPSVCGTWQEAGGRWHLVHVWRARVEYPALKRKAMSLAARWEPDAILIEDKSSGEALIQDLKAEPTMPLPVIAITPEKDKETRASVVSPLIEAGRVALPVKAPWLADYEAEVATFPNAAHDDQVDMTSQLLRWASKKRAPPRARIL